MNIWVRRSLALMVACSLSGCAMVSPQLKPDVSVAGAWNEPAPADAAAVSPTWWTTFDSPELESLVTEALAGSPDLAIATARVQQAEAQVRVADA
jgi:multidrug efflux system outer membrane protein